MKAGPRACDDFPAHQRHILERANTLMSSTPQPPPSGSYAAAAQPLATATLIKTDAAGLVAGDVEIATPTGALPAYRAAPDRPGPHPVILVVQEIFGLHEHIKDVTRRLAKLG